MAQCLLSLASWCMLPLAEAGTAPRYAPWYAELLLAPVCYLYLRVHPAQLSRLINLGCGQSFSDFVNGYRVAKAQRKLADPHFAHYSLVGVALESGFNSKSTFNRVFKKLTGQVPRALARPK